MATTKEILVKARDLIAKGWCQGELARAADGSYVHYIDERAVSYCMIGATLAAADADRESLNSQLSARQMLRDKLGSPNLAAFNDAIGRTQADILNLFDAVIKEME